jgi:uncharacterized phage protein gp47/JayE
MTFGLTDDGFIPKTLLDIRKEIESELISLNDANSTVKEEINFAPETLLGQLISTFAASHANVWEALEAVYQSAFRDTATGNSLDLVQQLNAVRRLADSFSRITGQAFFGSTGTLVPTGTLISKSTDPTVIFSTLTDITLSAGTDEVQNMSFSLVPDSGTFTLDFNGQVTSSINFDATTTDIQTALNNLSNLSGVAVTGSFAADFVITFSGQDGRQPQNIISENTNTLLNGATPVIITISETTSGVFQGTVDMLATETGPKFANANILTVIDTPVPGITRTFNPTDAVLGSDIENDPDYRLRGSTRVVVSRSATSEAIRNNILDLNNVVGSVQIVSAIILINNTLITNPQGQPGKSVQPVVYLAGGATTRDTEIAQAIFDSVGAGIETFGNVSNPIIDSEGLSHTIKFSRPDEINIFLELDLTTDSDFPTDGVDLLKTEIVKFGDALGVGKDVIVFPQLICAINNVPGITDVVVRIGTAINPTLDDNIIIDDGTGGNVEISVWDTSRIIITIL